MHSRIVTAKIRFWRIGEDHPEAEAIAEAASILGKGGVIVYPTETFYGLGGNPMSPETIERIYAIKGRQPDKPLPMIAASTEDARRCVADFPRDAEKLAEAFWPGPLTMLLQAGLRFPAGLHASTGRIALRVSSHPVARGLAAALDGLIISTSANFTGRPSCRAPAEIPDEFLERTDGLIDAGVLPGNLPSTIVDVSSRPLRIIREGQLSMESIEQALGA